jgi:spermidine synthase
MSSARRVSISVFLVGLCGLVAQVVVLREMIVTFHGNELSIGVFLAAWLLWTGLGSLGLGRVLRWCRRPRAWFAGVLVVSAAVLLATVAGARGLKLLLVSGEAAQGQVRAFRVMLLSSLVLLGPWCLINGLCFPLACRAAAAAGRLEPGRVYVLEAAGAAAGGAAYSFLLVGVVEPLTLALILAAGLCAASAGLASARGRWVALAGSAAALACGAAGLGGRAQSAMDRAYWAPRPLVSLDDSRFGRVTVVAPPQAEEQRSLFQDGTLAFTWPDPPTFEATVHLPMVQHPQPKRVLLLGGALGGLVAEVLRHPSVARVDCVQLDPQVVRSVRRHFPPGATAPLDDPRVHVIAADARAFLKHSAGRYDVAINAHGPPDTARSNRFYTVQFFRELTHRLAPGGVLAFRAPGGHNYIREENRRLLASLHRTASAVFPAVIAFPGVQVQFLASTDKERLTYRLDILQERLDRRGVAAPYADAMTWESQLVGGRLEELEAVFAEGEPAVNRDLSPRCYFYEAQRWSALQRARQAGGAAPALDLGQVLAWLAERPAAAPLMVLGLIALAALAVPLARGRVGEGAVAFAVASTGLIEMGVEFVILLGFQVAYGYVYHYLGLLVAAFMVGLTVGGAVATRWVRRGWGTWRRLTVVQAGIVAYPVVLLGFLLVTQGAGLAAAPLLAALAFSAVAFAAGLVGGLQFPLAASVRARASGHPPAEASWRAAGTLYGLDLFGSCVGALAVSSTLVPLFGLTAVCVMLSGLAALGLLGLLAAGRGGNRG